MAEVAAAAAVVGRDIGAQQSHGAGFAPDLSAHILLLAPLGLVRGHLRLDESRRRIAENRQIIIDPGRRVVVHLIGRFGGRGFRGQGRVGRLRHIRPPLLFRVLASLPGSLFLLLRVTIIRLGQRILQEMILRFRSYSACTETRTVKRCRPPPTMTPRSGETSPKSRPQATTICSLPTRMSLVGSRSTQPSGGQNTETQACDASAPSRPASGPGGGVVRR